jgi:hypothetical protein
VTAPRQRPWRAAATKTNGTLILQAETAPSLITLPAGLSCTWDEELTKSVILC